MGAVRVGGEPLRRPAPAPVRRRYELLGCSFGAQPPDGLAFLVLELLDKHGEATGWWDLKDVRILGHRPCARDLSLVDVSIEAVRDDGGWDYPERVPLSPGFRLTDLEHRADLGRCRDLAEVLPAPEPEPHSVRLLACAPRGPLRDVVEGHKKRRKLGYGELQVLDAAGERVTSAGYLDVLDWKPSPGGPGLYDLTAVMDPLPPVIAEIWPLWQGGGPYGANLWAPFDATGRNQWLGTALNSREWPPPPDRAAGATYHLDGRHVTDEAGFLCALGEAINGPGGYFGRSLAAVSDALCGGFGATSPFTLVWHDHEVARRCLGVQPLTYRPATFTELVAFLRERRIEVVLD